MDILMKILKSIGLPIVVVIFTSLPGFIVLRLYPILLDLDNVDHKSSEMDIWMFFLMIFLGTLIAILISDFLVGSFIATLIGLGIEFVLIILSKMLMYLGNSTIIFIVVLGLGLSIGFLQTIIAAFYGDRYDNDLWYSEDSHYNLYMLGYFIAYFLSVLITPLAYSTRFYGVCDPSSPNCYKFPLSIAIICLAATVVIFIFVYYTRDYERPDSKETTIYRMEQTLYIFIPFIFFWIFTLLIQEYWIHQAKNMYNSMLDHNWEIILAVIPIVGIPIGWFICIRNELLRITLGGFLIIISVVVSGLFGSFYVPVLRKPFEKDNLTEVNFCSLSVGTGKGVSSFYGISEVMFACPGHMCVGPFLFDEQMLFNTTNFTLTYNHNKIFSTTPYNLTVIYPQNGFTIIVQRPTPDILYQPMKDIIAAPDRNYRSIAKLALVRVFSISETIDKKIRANVYISIIGIHTDIEIIIASNYFYIMELPEGLYNVSTFSIVPTAKGNFSSSYSLYFRNGGYYILLASAPAYLTDDWRDQMEISIFTRIPGYVCSIYYQFYQYILLSIGKLLILSSGLEICYALAEKDMKCSLIGIFWGIYTFANFFFYFFYDILMNHFLDSISLMYINMLVAIMTFYLLYYFIAYKLTDVTLQVNI